MDQTAATRAPSPCIPVDSILHEHCPCFVSCVPRVLRVVRAQRVLRVLCLPSSCPTQRAKNHVPPGSRLVRVLVSPVLRVLCPSCPPCFPCASCPLLRMEVLCICVVVHVSRVGSVHVGACPRSSPRSQLAEEEPRQTDTNRALLAMRFDL